MAHQTEAACLLQTGAQYPRRLGLRAASGEGDLVFAGFKHGAFSLYFGDEPIDHFDLEGRWQRVFQNGIHYLKALDTSVAALERVREGENLVLHRRSLRDAEVAALDEAVRSRAADLLEAWKAGQLQPVEPPGPAEAISASELGQSLERVARWDAAAWSDHRVRYQTAYAPAGFLPPEAQQAVVLQATIGAAGGLSFGLSTACARSVRSLSEFEQHARAVAALLGKRVVQCRGVFLGGSDLLRLPLEEVAGYLRIISEIFPIEPGASRVRLRDLPESAARLGSLYALLDRFDSPPLGLDAWRHLRTLQLSRVILGIESGDAAVRDFYGKRWENEALRTIVANLKAAEFEVSLVTLIGAGGRELAEAHELATAALLNALPLGAGDLVYLLDTLEVGGEAVRVRMCSQGLMPLTDRDRLDQQGRLLAALKPLRAERGAKVAPYSLEKQWS